MPTPSTPRLEWYICRTMLHSPCFWAPNQSDKLSSAGPVPDQGHAFTLPGLRLGIGVFPKKVLLVPFWTYVPNMFWIKTKKQFMDCVEEEKNLSVTIIVSMFVLYCFWFYLELWIFSVFKIFLERTLILLHSFKIVSM